MGKIVVSQNVTLDGVVEDPSGEGGFRHGEWLDSLNRLPKYVVSATIQEPKWTNATVLAGEVVSEVSKLKQRGRRGRAPVRRDQRQAAPAAHPHQDRGERPRPPNLRARPRGLNRSAIGLQAYGFG